MTSPKVETQEQLKEKIEIKLLWLSHTLTDNEKKSLEKCVLELMFGDEYVDAERERIAFNEGVIWATEYLTRRNNPTPGDRKKDNE